MTTKNAIIATTVALVAIAAGAAWYLLRPQPVTVVPAPVATSTPPVAKSTHRVIGHSVEGRKIEAYTFGTGSTTLLFVGGMHGGYEWNSVLLAYDFIDYFNNHEAAVPANLTVAIIPNLNPDGVYKVIGKEGRFTLSDVPKNDGQASGAGRFNADQVDLNRNFACNWQATSTWRGQAVSAGTAAFSEPEAKALRDYVLETKPAAVAFWHSQANAVYASECHNGVLPATVAVMNTYAKAAGYRAVKSFDAYPITGDSEGWLASIGIPAITVEMSTHNTVEWNKNLNGVTALIDHYKTIAK